MKENKLITLALFLLVLAVVVDRARPTRVDFHVDTEHNVICYTTRVAMQCFPYVDQGTHLEFPSANLAL